ncbi:MAG TPA: 2-dehydro-3-deoxygalactonokinase [Anseongella sp.]|nr:2-dehydro-3-deoxygalactonokinase [Anseongella sp.]
MPASQSFILSCDWGTSSFRLRLVRLQDQAVTGEVSSAEGIAVVFGRWSLQKAAGRQDFYKEELRKHIRNLSARVRTSLENIPLVISGMASSSIGMTELPYAGVPFPLDGGKAVVQKLPPAGDFPHELFLVSGLRTQGDVMRGEETQVIGLMSHFGEKGATSRFTEGAVFIFPGTHSKHIYLDRDEVRDFETYMTGELFQLLANHSILKEAVDKGQGDRLREADLKGFRRGVSHPEARNLLHTYSPSA